MIVNRRLWTAYCTLLTENHKIICLIFTLLFSINLYSQQPEIDNQQIIENIIEEIANNTDEELDYTNLFDDLYFYFTNPINLNKTSEEELSKLQFLNDFQIKGIINYIRENGYFLSIYELQLLYGFTPEIIQYFIPFVHVSGVVETKKISMKNALKYGNNAIFLRYQQILEKQAGYAEISDSLYAEKPNSRYLGSSPKLYVRYKYTYRKNISWGITMEKDAGEEFFTGNQKKGFDYYSGFIQIKDISFIKSAVVGDYQLKFGQGLTLWSGIGGGKSAYVLNVKKKGNGLSKYSSTDENKFFRGAASTIKYKNFNITAFMSHKMVDANIDSITANGDVFSFTSLQNSGLHATQGEIYDKDAVAEIVFGGNITYSKKRFKAGLTYFDYTINTISSKEITASNKNQKYIAAYKNMGLNYQYYYRNFNFYGEVASNENIDIASVNGILVNLTNQVYLSAVYRYFQNEYYSYYGSTFSENSKITNEQGLYYGIEIYPYKNWKLSVYFDTYKFPYLKSRISSPSKGTDFFIQADFSPSRQVNMYFRLKNEIKQVNDNSSEEIEISPLIDQSNLKFRYHISYRISDQILLKNRFEYARFNKQYSDKENGYVVYQDINYHFRKIPLKLSFRYALFDTDTYNTRIYAYENDILYAFSIPAYYNKGTRSYLTIKYSLFRDFDIWLRIAQTYYSNLDHHGSGLTEINGRTKTDVKVQVRYKF